MNETYQPPVKRFRIKVLELERVLDGTEGNADVADLLNRPDGAETFGRLIREARPGPSWMIAHLDDVRGHDLDTAEGAADACEDIVDALLHTHPVARARYVQELALKLAVPEQAIRQSLNETLRLRREHHDIERFKKGKQ